MWGLVWLAAALAPHLLGYRSAWMQQGLTPAVWQGACGYGKLDKSQYPYWSVAALSLTNSFSVAGPAHACGMCFEIKCVDVGGAYGVRPIPGACPLLTLSGTTRSLRYHCLEHGCLHLEGRMRLRGLAAWR